MLRSKDLYEKTCKHCGLIFRTDKKRAYVCPTCLKRNEAAHQKSYRQEAKAKAENKPTKPAAVPLREQVRIIEKYNRDHKTNYTYGQFVELVNSGKIKL